MCFLTLMLFRGSFLYKWCLGAANQLQQKSVHRILYAPLGFFLQVGRRRRAVGSREGEGREAPYMHAQMAGQCPGRCQPSRPALVAPLPADPRW